MIHESIWLLWFRVMAVLWAVGKTVCGSEIHYSLLMIKCFMIVDKDQVLKMRFVAHLQWTFAHPLPSLLFFLLRWTQTAFVSLRHSTPRQYVSVITQYIVLILYIMQTRYDTIHVMNIEWDYNYYQPWSDNEWLVDEMLAILNEDIIMQ